MEIEPLSRGQQILLQRLLAAHAMTDDELQTIYQDLCQIDDASIMTAASLDKCLGQINKQLTKAFALEICSISIPGAGGVGTSQQKSQRTSSSSSQRSSSTHRNNNKNNNNHQRYYAVMNQHADDIAKKSFMSSSGDNTTRKWTNIARTPSEHEYIRQVLQHLVAAEPQQQDKDDDDDNNNNNNNKSSSPYSATMVDLINLKNNLKAPYKLSLDDAEQCILQLLDEKWLIVLSTTTTTNESSSRRQGRSSSRNNSSSKRTCIGLGPRAFLELPHLLTEFGIPKEDLPQTIYYRAA